MASNICLALHAGSSSVEQVANWIVEHEGDADIDEPLLVPKVGRRRLTLCWLRLVLAREAMTQ